MSNETLTRGSGQLRPSSSDKGEEPWWGSDSGGVRGVFEGPRRLASFWIHVTSLIHTFKETEKVGYTVPSEVFRPLDFFHILLHYSLILKLIKYIFSLINLHTIPHNDKVKILTYISIQTFAMRLEIELRWILFTLIILKLFLQLDWSPPVVNSIELIWFGKAHTCLFKVPQLTVHVRAKTKPWGLRNCP